MQKREEYIYKFRCDKCGKLLAGLNKKGYILFFKVNTSIALDGSNAEIKCGCGKNNLYNLIIIKEQLKNQRKKID